MMSFKTSLCVTFLFLTFLMQCTSFETAKTKSSKETADSNRDSSRQSSSAQSRSIKHENDEDDEDEEDYSKRSVHRAPSNSNSVSNAHDGVFSYRIDHSLNMVDWRQRGTASVVFSQMSRKGTVKFNEDQTVWTDEDVKSFKSLVAQEDFYRIRYVPINPTTKQPLKEEKHHVTASVKACALATSQFRELVVLNYDIYGNLLGLDYKAPVTACSDQIAYPIKKGLVVMSKGKIFLGKSGESPKSIREPSEVDPALRAEAEAAKSVGNNKDGQPVPDANKNFFQKYWMYIVPIGIYMLLQAATGEQPAAAGQGGGAGKGGKAQ